MKTLCALFIVLFLSVIVTGTSYPQDSLLFEPASFYDVGTWPISVAVGHFDDDSNEDLAVANWLSDNVSILLGDGSGSFDSASFYAVGDGPRSVATGDFDNDGNSDLAVCHQWSNNVGILLGDGTGSFGEPSFYDVVGSDQLTSLAVGDFNSDTYEDLVVVSVVTNNVAILMGDSTGAFGSASFFPAGTHPRHVAVGHFDSDNNEDLAVANEQDNTVAILFGFGNGSFDTASFYTAGNQPSSVAVGDFNDDTNEDLAVTHELSDSVAILLGDSTGTFTVDSFYVAGNYGISVVVSDFDNDSTDDLAFANLNIDNVAVLLGNGNGTFGAASYYGVGNAPASVSVGDFNTDGIHDLAVANTNSDDVAILLGSGPVNLILSPSGPTTVFKEDTLYFNSLITNTTGNPLEGDYWLSVQLPDSSEVLIPEMLLKYSNPLHGIVSNSLEFLNWLFIPSQADTGSYNLIGRIGIYPSPIVDEESFGFQVVQ